MEEIFERGNMVITKSPVNKNYTWHISRFPAMKSDPEGMIELADAIYKAEGVDLRAEVTRLTAERDRMREALRDLVDTWAPDSKATVDETYLSWKNAYLTIYPDSALESEANND